MADDMLHSTDLGAPIRFSNDLGRFASNTGETLKAIDSRLHSIFSTLADREAQWSREVADREDAYDNADDESRNAAWHALEEAKSSLRDVRYWQQQLTEAEREYQRVSNEVWVLLQEHTPKAQAALKEHVDLLYAYLAVPPPDFADGVTNLNPSSIVGNLDGTFDHIPVNAFSLSSLVSDKAVSDYLEKFIPVEHRNPFTLRSISYEDRFETDNEGTLLGFTDQSHSRYDTIHILRHLRDSSGTRDELLETIAHEVGHHVQRHVLGELRSIHWQQLFLHSGKENFVTNYAKQSAEEDFSECYSVYIHDPSHLPRVSEPKYAFLRDYVFMGRKYL